MRFIKDFNSYVLNEEAGYGNDYFVEKKVDKSMCYYFKVGKGENETGLIFNIGKFSRSSVISDSEKSYGVIHIEQIDANDLDDYLVNDSEYKSREEKKFEVSNDVLNGAFEILGKAMDDYLRKNPKVDKFYDEILENIVMDPDDYLDFIRPYINRWSDGRWTIQSGSSKNVLIYTKTSHE